MTSFILKIRNEHPGKMQQRSRVRRLVALALLLAVLAPLATPAATTRLVAWGANNYGQLNIPSSTVNAVAVAAGKQCALALRADGTVAAWGYPSILTKVPVDLTNAIAISVCDTHCLALRADGTVAAWGQGAPWFPTNVPPDLTNVVAIATAVGRSMALKVDGTVQVWGRRTAANDAVVLPTLTNIAAVAQGYDHSLALRSNGTVVAWGGTATTNNFPVGLSNVTAITAGVSHGVAITTNGELVAWGRYAGVSGCGSDLLPGAGGPVTAASAGQNYSLALRPDRTLIAWGCNGVVVTNTPLDLPQVAAISAGDTFALALQFTDFGPAAILTQPQSLTCWEGTNAFLVGHAVGEPPLVHQWFHNGQPLAGATNENLELPGVAQSQEGAYYFVASNSLNAVTSAVARLVVYRQLTAELVGTWSVTNCDLANLQFNGNHAYVADRRTGTRILDVANPASPVQISTIPALANDTHNLEIRDRFAFTAEGNGGMQVTDISEPAAPCYVGRYAGAGFFHFLKLDRQAAYLMNLNGGMHIVDIANPANPRLLTVNTNAIASSGIDIAGQTAYVACSSRGLVTLDIANPAAPVWLSTFITNSPFTSFHEVQAKEGYAYLANHYDGIEVLNVSDPASPKLANVLEDHPWSITRRVRTAGRYLMSVNNTYGVDIYDVSEPANLVKVLAITRPAASAEIAGDYLFLSNGSEGLLIYHVPGLSDGGPEIVWQPQTTVVGEEEPLCLTANTRGNFPLIFQWRQAGCDIPNATNATFKLPAAQFTDAGDYSVVVSNPYGTLTSSVASVTVTLAPNRPRLALSQQGNDWVLDYWLQQSNGTMTIIATEEPIGFDANGSVVHSGPIPEGRHGRFVLTNQIPVGIRFYRLKEMPAPPGE